MKKFETSYIWKGKDCLLEADVSPADRSVGIMGPSLECIKLFDEEGKEIPLTDEEAEQIAEDPKLYEALEDAYTAEAEAWEERAYDRYRR